MNPQRPAEVWVELGPLGWPTANIEVISLILTVIQLAMSLGAAGGLLLRYRRGDRVIPWQLEVFNFVPLWLECFVLGLVALV